ncbi:MAG: hypothetical protein J6C44_03030 [Muribaculaceae bacterium]|nr:hypothetical protein [Muribaculaceae bacterium]
MNTLKYLILFILPVLTISCGEDTQESALKRAEDAIANGQYSQAIEICDQIPKSDAEKQLTPGEMCRVAMIYAVAADNDVDREENIARSAQWLDRATKVNADSVQQYLVSLTPQEMGLIHQVQQLNNTKGYDFSHIDEEPMDSITEPHPNHEQ